MQNWLILDLMDLEELLDEYVTEKKLRVPIRQLKKFYWELGDDD